jgi:hypothetical protein
MSTLEGATTYEIGPCICYDPSIECLKCKGHVTWASIEQELSSSFVSSDEDTKPPTPYPRSPGYVEKFLSSDDESDYQFNEAELALLRAPRKASRPNPGTWLAESLKVLKSEESKTAEV